MLIDRYRFVIQGVLFYIVWFVGVLLVAAGHEWLATWLFLIFSLLCIVQSRIAAFPLMLISVVSIMADAVAINFLKVYSYRSSHFNLFDLPFWIIFLWIGFTFCYGGCLRFLLSWRPIYLALLGAVAGPLSMVGAHRLGAVTFPGGVSAAVAVLSMLWSIVVVGAVMSLRWYRSSHRYEIRS